MDDENKLLEFMTKMYLEMEAGFKSMDEQFNILNDKFENIEAEMASIKKDVSTLKGDVSILKENVVVLKMDVQNIGATIDGELIPKQQALFDVYKHNVEVLFKAEENIDVLKDNVSDINDSISEMKEDVNFIAAKTMRYDTKLEKLNNQLKAVK